jgi:phage tail sheath gpL-like
MGIGDTGISPSYKVPRFIAKIVLASGSVSAGAERLKVLCAGMKTAGGSLTADGAPARCTSEDEADALAGAGSMLAVQAYQALKVPSVELYLQAVTEPGAGTPATATMVIGGTWSVGGTLRFRIAGKSVFVNVSTSMTVDDVGTAVAAAFNAKSRLPVTAAYNSSTDTVTLTAKNKGALGRDWILYHDVTDRPAGMTIALTGSANVNTNGVRLGAAGSGTGVEDVTTALTKLQTTRYARIAPDHNDATNAALWETHVNNLAGPLSLLLEHLVFGHNGALASAQSLAQTTLNAFRAQVCWLRNGENHPAEIAALVAAVRAVKEQTQWVPDYDGYVLSSLKGQEFESDVPTDTEQDTALNNGVTPLTTVNGEVKIVRAITTYCLNGSSQDERCLDIGDAVMPDAGTIDLKLMYETEYRPQNPLVGPDPAEGEEPPPAGVGYPKFWNSKVAERMETWFDAGWLEERPVGVWAPVSTYNKVGKYIQSEAPLPVRRVQHRLDAVIRQVSNSA